MAWAIDCNLTERADALASSWRSSSGHAAQIKLMRPGSRPAGSAREWRPAFATSYGTLEAATAKYPFSE
jgi:hypothetical protein